MKIFSEAPDGNEAAELENAHYFNLAIEKIEESNEWLKKAEKPYQVMLVHLDILLMLSRKYKADANLSIKKDRVQNGKILLTHGLLGAVIKSLQNIEMELKKTLKSYFMN
ncbi:MULTISPECIES: hypothetical protein [unclassified Lysinibacillus]|uniref:hypothetical protein n=1 Tax=unclassified Lysinibacillus TaxID=2636778 RepID=UPI002552284F|nr:MULTISPECIES: hypothetical protein [unclassified Lysinibacillus]MDM5247632.1 hypothetical protein [Lysinibacillus sp. G4S2]